METAKLKKPLFYEGKFNSAGHSMWAVFVKDISHGSDTFHLWQNAGKRDISFPRAENDNYILYVEINGYLFSLRMTEYQLINNCGWLPAVETLYGDKERRQEYLDGTLQYSQPDGAYGAAIDRENTEIHRYGSDPARQIEYIKAQLQEHVETYQKAKENGGETFPDFIGALILDDLSTCQMLSAVHKENRRLKEIERRQKKREEEIALVEKKNEEMVEHINEAISILKNGGTLKNELIQVYTLTEDSYTASGYSIFNYLMRRYGVQVPLRTQGWINKSLIHAVITDGRFATYHYWKSKRGKGSDTFCDCMNRLIAAINNQSAV